MVLTLKHDPDSNISYGYFRCQDCGVAMFGGGPFHHKKDCARDGYEGLEYHLGNKALRAVLDGTDRLNPVSAADVEAQLPEICARLRQERDLAEAMDNVHRALQRECEKEAL